AQLAAEFPTMRWILVGDDGQHDPSIYAEFAERHPELVDSVLIRRLTEPEQLLAHGSRRPRDSSPHYGGTPLTLTAPDGHCLLSALQRTGRIRSCPRSTPPRSTPPPRISPPGCAPPARAMSARSSPWSSAPT